MLGSFHTAKCVQHCIGKYIQGSGIEDSLTQTKVLGVKVLKSVIDGTNYARALKVILILSNAITRLKWQAFLKTKDAVQVNEYAVLLSDLQQALSAKDPDRSKRAYRDCMTSVLMLKKDFAEFSQTCAEKSEMCRYWDGLIKLSRTLTSLIAADRDGNWALHLLSIQELLPVFCVSGSINYQRYGSWYLEKMRKLPDEYPEIYKNFLDGKFVVKTGHGHFNAVAPDMKLEQTIQRSKKGAGGVVGQMKHEAFVTEWELCYHEVLAISKYHAEITGSVLASSDAEPLHREL